MSEEPILEGIVTEQFSILLYEVECFDGRKLVASLGKIVISGAKLSIGARVFVKLVDRPNYDGKILNKLDFKINGWEGWTDQHEPKL
ncbi:hypothetical protein [Haliscomenobacter sp.]|uniref:hypothetical protein n=1 Tax=Haliscomenobacter sp. TaxID=2717303 RepID=UPI0035935033